MATLASGQLTLADWAKRLDPEGKIEVKIAEILNQTNEILDDAVFIEGNLPTGHRVTIRTGLPAVYWRSLNQGVPRSKSTSAQVDESCGMLEAYSAVDKDLAELNGNPFKAYQTHYQWKNGLVVKDWRYVVRICNINTANLVAESAAADLIKLMSRALDRVPNLSMGRAAFYMNRTLFSMMRIQALNKSQNAISVQEGLTQFGHPTKWLDFLGVPIRKVDQLLNTEARVV